MKKFLMTLLAALLVLGMFSAVALADGTCDQYGKDCVPSGWKTIKEATCTEEGAENNVCTVCGKVLDHRTVAKVDHAWGDWQVVKEATCNAAGEKIRECKVCGAKDTQTIATAKDAHAWDSGYISVEPTCTKEGEKVFICNICGQMKKDILPMTKHDSTVEKITKEATCTEEGVKTFSCSVCGAVQKTEAIKKLNHDLVGVKVKVAPTCTDAGTNEAVCTMCHGTFDSAQISSLAIPKLGHDYDGVMVNKVSCNADGLERYTCTRCGDTYDKIIFADEKYHVWNESIVKPATETEKGLKHFVCSVCDTWRDEVFELAKEPAKDPEEPEVKPTQEPEKDPEVKPTQEPEKEPDVQPTKKPTPNKPSTNDKGVTIPATGDRTSSLPYAMMAVSLIGLAVLALSKRKVNG